MTAGRTTEEKIERENEKKRKHQALISDLDTLKKKFSALKTGSEDLPGFDVIREKSKRPQDDLRLHSNIKSEWSAILDKMRDSEKHEYNFYEFNLRWIIQDGCENLDKLLGALNYLSTSAYSFTDDPYTKNAMKRSRHIDTCTLASRTIDEINRFITKIEKHIFTPEITLSTRQTLLMGGYLSIVLLRSFLPVEDWRPLRSEHEEMDMFKTYLNDLLERLEKIRHTTQTGIAVAQKGLDDYWNALMIEIEDRRKAPQSHHKLSLFSKAQPDATQEEHKPESEHTPEPSRP